jgi:hypothetical protein
MRLRSAQRIFYGPFPTTAPKQALQYNHRIRRSAMEADDNFYSG